jgi:hypothetical protein
MLQKRPCDASTLSRGPLSTLYAMAGAVWVNVSLNDKGYARKDLP